MLLGLTMLLASCSAGEPEAGLAPAPPSPVVQLVVSPATATISSDEVKLFTAGAVHADGGNSVPSVVWSATGGSISSSGAYTPGPTGGTFVVTATLSGSTLTGTASVTIVPVVSPIVSLSVSPGDVTLPAGDTQVFTVSATRQDGSTLVPSVAWSATGGSITGGLYSAGGAPGEYKIVATLQGGVLADTATVTLLPPPGGPYPNRPANFSNSRLIDFSQAVPSAGPSGDRPVAGIDWAVLYDGNPSNFTHLTDPAAPGSPPGVWQVRFPPGSYGGGVIGQGTGWGAGNVFTDSPISARPSALYVSVWHKVDPNYQWHPISNKFLYISPGQVLVQIKEGSKWLHAESLNMGQWLDPQGPLNGAVLIKYKNDPVSKGVWHHYEFLIDIAAGTFKVWLDGDLKTSAINVRFSESYFNEVNMTAYRGGGGETLTQELFWYYDEVLVAWP